eukprot:12921052-Alexandrium_andersonii.AAC.1
MAACRRSARSRRRSASAGWSSSRSISAKASKAPSTLRGRSILLSIAAKTAARNLRVAGSGAGVGSQP